MPVGDLCSAEGCWAVRLGHSGVAAPAAAPRVPCGKYGMGEEHGMGKEHKWHSHE